MDCPFSVLLNPVLLLSLQRYWRCIRVAWRFSGLVTIAWTAKSRRSIGIYNPVPYAVRALKERGDSREEWQREGRERK